MMMHRTAVFSATLLLLFTNQLSALSPATPSRRQILSSGACWTTAAVAGVAFGMPLVAIADDQQVALSEEEMAARVAKKLALQRAASGVGPKPVGATDIRSDVNPEAGVNLRSRSSFENAKVAMAKQNEMKNRDKAQKREDLCEMLGRGC
mmetsp:Transcript_39505/g.58043  ORF Transcript_39505/g.58043 Transcript_39505/m.58043 type:complete len:150 (-) Transcript_39505:185-634(-)